MNKLSITIKAAICLIGLIICPGTTFSQIVAPKSSYVVFTGEIKGGQFGRDSIRIEYQPNSMHNLCPGFITEYSVHYIKADKDGEFRLELPNPSGIGTIRFDLFGYQHGRKTQGHTSYNPLLTGMLSSFPVELGDSIHFSITNYGDTSIPYYSISGRGSAKYKVMKDINFLSRLDIETETNLDISDYFASVKKGQDIQLAAQNSLLINSKSMLSNPVFNFMKADVQGHLDLFMIKQLFNLNNPKFQNRIASLVESYAPKIDSNASPLSTRYLHAIILNKILILKIKQKNYTEKHKMKEAYLALKNNFSGLLRDKLISNYLLFEGWRGLELAEDGVNVYDECLQDCYDTLQDSFLKSVLANKLKKVKRGVAAYNFDLPDANGNRVKLINFQGKVVLVDIYGTVCTSCRVFAKTLKEEVFPVFKNNPNVVFVAISIEPKKQRWLEDIEEGFNTDKKNEIILYTEGLGINHPMMKYYNTNSMPLLLLIDKKGKIANSSFDQLTAGSTGARIIKLINNAIEERKNL